MHGFLHHTLFYLFIHILLTVSILLQVFHLFIVFYFLMSLHPQAYWRVSLLERAAGEVGVGVLLWGEKLAHIVAFKVTGTTLENTGMVGVGGVL